MKAVDLLLKCGLTAQQRAVYECSLDLHKKSLKAEAVLSKVPAPDIEQGHVEVDVCSICYEDQDGGDEVSKLPCGHQFHKRCVKKWLISGVESQWVSFCALWPYPPAIACKPVPCSYEFLVGMLLGHPAFGTNDLCQVRFALNFTLTWYQFFVHFALLSVLFLGMTLYNRHQPSYAIWWDCICRFCRYWLHVFFLHRRFHALPLVQLRSQLQSAPVWSVKLKLRDVRVHGPQPVLARDEMTWDDLSMPCNDLKWCYQYVHLVIQKWVNETLIHACFIAGILRKVPS